MTNTWWPDWTEGWQSLLLTLSLGRLSVQWQGPEVEMSRGWLADWLEERRRVLPASELDEEQEYVAICLGRLPTGSDDLGRVGGDSPVQRFGYGLIDGYSEALPLVQFLDVAVCCLRRELTK